MIKSNKYISMYLRIVSSYLYKAATCDVSSFADGCFWLFYQKHDFHMILPRAAIATAAKKEAVNTSGLVHIDTLAIPAEAEDPVLVVGGPPSFPPHESFCSCLSVCLPFLDWPSILNASKLSGHLSNVEFKIASASSYSFNRRLARAASRFALVLVARSSCSSVSPSIDFTAERA